jgi:hypothetical protein
VVKTTRESGVALIFAIVALAIVALMVVAVAAAIQPRIITHNHLERTVRLTALVDAAMATSLAELALNRHYPGFAERTLGDGIMSSTVTQVGLHEVEVVVTGRSRNWRAVVVARVDVEHGARVLRWSRFQSPD